MQSDDDWSHNSRVAIQFRRHGEKLVVFGQTFPFREVLKGLGARYNGADKTWILGYTEEVITTLERLGDARPMPIRTPSNDVGPLTTDPSLGLSVRQLMDQAQLALAVGFPAPVWVVGEIQNCSLKNGHVFMNLAEGRDSGDDVATVTVKATIWASQLKALSTVQPISDLLQDGMRVRCLCRVVLFRERGQISLVVEDIDSSFTKGALALAREALLKKLRSQGLDQKNKRTSLPAFPFRVGLITASGSRAVSDFTDQLATGGFPGLVLFAPTPMQGDQVPLAVCASMDLLISQGVDVIVITRGGGSAADLRWFDAGEIACHIATCPLPVIAAIGHHEDVCVAEEICFLRQKTPTAAAEFILSCFRDVQGRLQEAAEFFTRRLTHELERVFQLQQVLRERLLGQVQMAWGRRSEHLLRLEQSLFTAGQHLSQRGAQTLMGRAHNLVLAAERHFQTASVQLNSLEKSLVGLDPRPWIEGGWTQLYGDRGPIRTITHVHEGERVSARLKDGKVNLVVAGTELRLTKGGHAHE